MSRPGTGNDEATQQIGMVQRELQRDRAAHREAQHVNLPMAECTRDAGGVGGKHGQ